VEVLIIGCGSYQPIDTYAAQSSSLYPIYTDPTLRLHSIFDFKSNLAEGKAGDEKRDYMRDAGGAMSRVWGGIKGALGHLEHINSVGPKALNGGEVIVSAGEFFLNNRAFFGVSFAKDVMTEGECEYIYRMQNTVDHTDISKLASLIGVECVVPKAEEQTKVACGDSCDVAAERG
jgi:hypothetical protein